MVRAACLLAAVVTIGATVPVAVVTLGSALPAAAQTSSTTHEVTGTLLDAQGDPIAGRIVVITENRGLANDIFGAFAAVFTLGLSCAEGEDPCRASGSSSTTTDASGRFAFSVSQVSTALGRSNGLILAAGSATTGGLTVKLNPSLGGDLGDLELWDPHLTTQTTAGLLHIGWTAPPGANSQTVVDGAVVWPPQGEWASIEHEGVQGQIELDPRSWEDRPALFSLTAGFHRPRANQSPRIDWLSAPVSLPSGGVPLSRSAACSFAGIAALQTCPLTDGNLLRVAPLPCTVSAPCSPANATLDLGRQVQAGLVAVRGSATYTAEVSSDAQTWRTLIVAPPEPMWPAQLYEASGSTWRYLRVSPGQKLAQVSVWPGETTTRATTPSTTTLMPSKAPEALPAPSSQGHHHTSYLVWELIAGALVILAAATTLRFVRRT